MGWKMYYLVNDYKPKPVANAALPILEDLGYSPAYAATDSTSVGVLSVTIDGVVYSGNVYAAQNIVAHYLCVNDETNDILITSSYQNSSGLTANPKNSVCFAILSGTDLLSGAPGMFSINTNTPFNTIANTWNSTAPPSEVFVIQKAVFFANASYTAYNANNFESTLYWGSTAHSPGMVVSIGADSFVCLGFNLFAKL